MTCGEFNQRVDAVLSGDVTDSGLSTATVREHVERCDTCARTWSGVRALLDVMVDPAEHESTQEVEVAVDRLRRDVRPGRVRCVAR